MNIQLKKFCLKKRTEKDYGFGLVDAVLSMSLLLGVITYGIYFSSLRLNTVYNSNLTRSINKEIQRDIERLKSELWCMYFEGKPDCQGNPVCNGQYCLSNGESLPRYKCKDMAIEILNLNSWNVGENPGSIIQSWVPGPKRSKVFTGEKVTISRTLTVKSPLNNQLIDKSIGSIDYTVSWGKEIKHWVSIDLAPEAHSWCAQVI
tara:strand:- start:627 stop:1238 length:612 start_codon:yes stop_codon:yes gene_type:complete